MVEFTVVIREIGRQKPDYSLDFEAPSLPREGDYLSVQRPDKPTPFGEDLIVRKVWWRLDHPETGGLVDKPKTGTLNEIFVECDPAIGPYSSDHWRDMLQAAQGSGVDVHEFELERFAVREADI